MCIVAELKVALEWHLGDYGFQLHHSDESEADILDFRANRTGDVDFEIGVNLVVRRKGVSADVALGARHREVAKLDAIFSQFNEEACTVGMSLADALRRAGRPSPFLRRWCVSDEVSASEVALCIREDVRDFGIPFLEMVSTLEKMHYRLSVAPRDTLEERRYAIICALRGEWQAARQSLGEYVDFALADGGLVSLQAVEFTRAFVKHFPYAGPQ